MELMKHDLKKSERQDLDIVNGFFSLWRDFVLPGLPPASPEDNDQDLINVPDQDN